MIDLAEIPKDIISGNVALIATITDISPNVLTKIIAAILDCSGVYLTNVNCSRSTASRKMKQTAHEMAVIAKEDVELSIQASPYPCIMHFDGKTLFEINNGKKLKHDRLAVLTTIDNESHLLGVTPLPSSSGEDQYNGVMKVLKEYNLESKIGLLCFDTTSSNTGIHKGPLIRISTELNKYIILLACRHHVSEFRITHFCEAITNEKTTAPDNPLFKHFKNFFEQPNFEYNPSMLVKFGWEEIKGTVVEKAVTESLEYCRSYILRNNIVREDRKELAELVVSYLSPSIIKIRKTGAVHHAKFLGKSIYYLKMQILSTQINFIQKNREHIKVITEFIACFYAKWYLQSNDTIKASFMDVTAIHQMHQHKAICAEPFAVDAVLNSLFKHTWYLDSTLIPLALLDDGVAIEEKNCCCNIIISKT